MNRSQQKEIIQILAWIVVLTGIHLITFGETRHRLPLDSFFMLFTAMAATIWIRDRVPISLTDRRPQMRGAP